MLRNFSGGSSQNGTKLQWGKQPTYMAHMPAMALLSAACAISAAVKYASCLLNLLGFLCYIIEYFSVKINRCRASIHEHNDSPVCGRMAKTARETTEHDSSGLPAAAAVVYLI